MEVVFGVSQMPKAGVSLNLLEEGLIFEGKNFTLHAFAVQHRGAGCFGFTFEEKARRPFLADKAEALGIPHGPIRRDLAQGQAVTLPNGNTIRPEDILGEPQRGTKLCFVGDVSHTGPLHKLVAGADLLAIEATYLDTDKELAKQHGHITAKAAARLAQKSGVKQLLLHHISRRYRSREILEEAQTVFPATQIAHDLDQFKVNRNKPLQIQNLSQRNQA